jgi:phosphoribosylamine---glycine ligase
MKVLVIGAGGREHALVWKLAQSPLLSALFCAPGNPGIAAHATCVPVQAGDLRGLLAFALDREIDLTIVGPEQPLAEGITDLFQSRGLAVFGPSRAAARLEWSKAFAKDFMRRHGIPTAGYRSFTRAAHAEARAYLQTLRGRVVLKADGLAAGKGVVICDDPSAAAPVLDEMMSGHAFGAAGETIVVEEFLEGVEASVFAIADGADHLVLAPARDHKRALDGDRGKNTGGMGAYAPAPAVTPALLDTITREIIVPTLSGMREEGTPFAGCLYVGVMLTPSGPKVVEYNCRFGDPETQVVLPLFGGDLLRVLHAAASHGLRRMPGEMVPQRSAGAAVCVVLASEGYPDRYPTGRAIAGLEDAAVVPGVMVFHAGTVEQEGKPLTAGGRVLGVTAVARDGDFGRARDAAYEAAGRIRFEGMQYRRDIAESALHPAEPPPGHDR